jgi:hypothetical protein
MTMPTKPKNDGQTIARSLSSIALLLLCGLLSTGCSSMNGPGSASFASVVITNRSTTEIQAATVQVFTEHGYWGGVSDSAGRMVFETGGSRANTVAREGVLATYQGARTLVRVRAEVVGWGDGARRLQGQAFSVSGAGDAFFEEEQRLSNLRSGPYQSLFDEVAKRLKQP